ATPPLWTCPCGKPPSPPAWIMQPVPDWQKPLNGIISSSENG
ncbi:Rz1 family lipoprotein, partial [Escherichia coli]